MNLPQADAERFIDLITDIDHYALVAFKVYRKKESVNDFNEIRLAARQKWQNDTCFIGKYLAIVKDLDPSDADLIRSWRGIRRNEYIVFKYYAEYTVFYCVQDGNFYGVKGLADRVDVLLPKKSHPFIRTSLFPYGGQIVCDGLIESSDYRVSDHAIDLLGDLYCDTKEMDQVIFQL